MSRRIREAVSRGDGLVEGGEECDDGADNNDNGACTRRCEVAECGDGLEYFESEQCDDSNAIDGDGCDSNCTLTACGNGIQTEGEECDDGNDDDTDGCRSDCVFSVCNAATPDGTPCTDDGVFCNGPEVCQAGECVPSGSLVLKTACRAPQSCATRSAIFVTRSIQTVAWSGGFVSRMVTEAL